MKTKKQERTINHRNKDILQVIDMNKLTTSIHDNIGEHKVNYSDQLKDEFKGLTHPNTQNKNALIEALLSKLEKQDFTVTPEILEIKEKI